MTVSCCYCSAEHEADDPKDIGVLVYWGEAARVFCDAECWLNEMLFQKDDAA